MKFDRHIFNALMFDICNWTLNGFLVAFVWSVSHYYCVAICGMYIMRFIADFMYRRSMYAEQLAARTKMIADLNAQIAAQKQTDSEMDFTEQADLFESLENDVTPINPTDKKIH